MTRKTKTDEPPSDALEVVVVEGTPYKPEIIRRGFFQIVINGPDAKPTVQLDVTMLPADVQVLLKQARDTLQDAKDVEIDSQLYEYAATLRRKARDDHAALEKARTAITSRIDTYREAVMLAFRGDKDLKDGAVPSLDTARLLLDQKLNDYLAAEELKRKEAQRLENERIEKERKLKEDEQRRIEAEAAEEQARLRKEAEKAAQAGDDDKLAEIVERGREVADAADERTAQLADEVSMLHPSTLATAAPPKVAGFTPSKRWECEVLDPMEFFKGIVAGKIPKVYGAWDQSGLNKQAALLKDDLDYPGCKAKEKKGGTSR